MLPTTIDICKSINKSLPDDSPHKNLNSMLIYNTSGLKPRVKENNPKTLVSEVNRMKAYAKATGNSVSTFVSLTDSFTPSKAFLVM